MNVCPFIEAEQAEQRNVAKACALLEVSRSAFYELVKAHPVSTLREVADGELAERITQIHARSRGTYGWPRALAASPRRDPGRRQAGGGGSCANTA